MSEKGIKLELHQDGDGVYTDNQGFYYAPMKIEFDATTFKNDDGVMNIASVIPNNIATAPDYLSQVADYEDDSLDHDDEVELCRKLYEHEGAVSTAIDVIVELAVTDGYVTNCSDECRKLCEYWIENVNNFRDLKKANKSKVNTNAPEVAKKLSGIYVVAESLLLEYLVTGDAVATEFWQKIPVLLDGSKQTYTLPTDINVHLIENIEVSDALAAVGKEIIYLKIPQELQDLLNDQKDPESKLLRESLPPAILKAVSAKQERIPLPSVLVTHFKRRGIGKAYGTPYLRKAFTAVAQKRRLQALDTATITGLIQQLIIISVGHDDWQSPYHVPEPGRVALLKSILKKTQASKMLIWSGPDLKVQTIGPDGKVLSFEKRFNEADDNISMSLGIPRLLIDGASSGTSSRDWSVFLSTISRLVTLRRMMAAKITEWLRDIAFYNGFEDESPEWEWTPIQLKDERVLKTQFMKAYENGLIGRRDTLIHIGLNPDKTIARQLEEKKLGYDQQLTPPPISFSANPNGQGGDNPNSQNKTAQGRPKDTEGRPPGKTEVKQREGASLEVADRYWLDILNGNYDFIAEIVGLAASSSEAKTNMRVGFYNMGRTMDTFLKAELSRAVGEARRHEWEIPLLGWNDTYLTAFCKQIGDALPADKSMWLAHVETFRGRLDQYHREGLSKISTIKRIIELEDAGFTAFGVVPGDGACDACVDNAKLSHDKYGAFNAHPCHPHCSCGLEGR